MIKEMFKGNSEAAQRYLADTRDYGNNLTWVEFNKEDSSYSILKEY